MMALKQQKEFSTLTKEFVGKDAEALLNAVEANITPGLSLLSAGCEQVFENAISRFGMKMIDFFCCWNDVGNGNGNSISIGAGFCVVRLIGISFSSCVIISKA